MIRATLLTFALCNALYSAELTVFTSAEAWEKQGASASLWYSDGSWIDKVPEPTFVQEGQMMRQVYRNLKPGKYRIVLDPIEPIGFRDSLMETHVNLKKDASESVILIAHEHKNVDLPAELIEAFKKFDGNVMWDLSVRYPGFVGGDKFYQVRAISDSKDYKKFIHYLRSDGEYTISFWDDDPKKGYAYEKNFRVGAEKQNDQGGADQPAAAPELNSEQEKNTNPESKLVLTENHPIVSVEIRDFNWETRVTTTYRISPSLIEVSTNEAKPYEEVVKPSAEGAELLGKCLRGITTIHEGEYADDQVLDGVMIEFKFTLQDGSKHSTKLNNIRIESYAELTKRVSEMVKRDIQYDQYRMKALPGQKVSVDSRSSIQPLKH